MDRERRVLLLLLLRHRRKRRRIIRKHWISSFIALRNSDGLFFFKEYQELVLDEKRFYNFFRMSVSTFEGLLQSLEPHIRKQYTNMRNPVEPIEMMGITLRVLLLGASISAGLFVFHIAVVPLIFKYSKTFRRTLIFANFVQWPPNVDFEDPSASGIEGGRNLSVEYQSKVDNCAVKIGIWHILPASVYERLKSNFGTKADKEELNKLLDEELANSKTPIMLYCHGNSNSRAASHRIQLYKFFQQMDFHTIAFDYRGYGDSTNLNPSEDGVVEDSLVVYEWLYNTVNRGSDKPPIFVWGHSLGTGISSHLLGNLEDLSSRVLERATPLPLPNGLILESPFNNLADEVANHPLSKLVTWLPYYECTFVRPFRAAREHAFRSDGHLRRARALPLLLLHAKDDVIVPFLVGLKLYRSVLESRTAGGAPVILHAYDKNEKLGHKWICNAKDLPEVIGDFVKKNI